MRDDTAPRAQHHTRRRRPTSEGLSSDVRALGGAVVTHPHARSARLGRTVAPSDASGC